MIARTKGFTLIELLIALTLIGVMVAIAAPSIRDTIRNARMTGAANDLLSDLSVARAEAVKRATPTAVCASSNGTSCTGSWNQGWIIFTDSPTSGTPGVVDGGTDVILKKTPAIEGANDTPPNTIVAKAGQGWIGFRPSGMVKAGGGAVDGSDDIEFYLCDWRTAANVGDSAAKDRGRRINVSLTGRAYIARRTCP